mmetsp:Transcript_1868/g.2965  ORF Transcript_1868/g.2965 Transcript_1868/m.2965 type:complete len:680 (-) Transcript_1868:102-2141(-)|eukprot:CAMPEP_0185028814 /NCGR_PEP_ID=MMETSP1103-20130426/14823_1 /TAXON_ID=36769 /ORGANISM="Paraphysomonas bandaiensis, Strain Caron Lab Isolate" /LENGTH=679 /DNA_ID=CAMNT_0027563351 /DNA_START=63 /DNA_END=2102 /DNA_ORIENTATION=-
MAAQGEKSLNVDVDALFGVEAVKETEANESIRRGTRTRARKMSLTHGKSFAKLFSNHSGLSVDEVASFESTQMTFAEFEQTGTDKFWGLDKEAGDRSLEVALMNKAAEESAAHELFCKTMLTQKKWEEEEALRIRQEAFHASVEEESARQSYLKSFYSATYSGDIMHYKWPTRPEVKCDDDLQAAGSDRLKSRNNRSVSEGYEIWTMEGEPSTIHLDGLQQSRTVSLNGETYDPRKIASIADLAMRPAGTRKNKQSSSAAGHSSTSSVPPATSPRIMQLQSMASTTGAGSPREAGLLSGGPNNNNNNNPPSSNTRLGSSPGISRSYIADSGPKYLKDSQKVLLTDVEPKHCEIIDGHPLLRWDMSEMLRAAFALLDSEGTGRIRRETIPEIGKSAAVQAYLRFTVFWMSLKRRQWGFFYAIFDDLDDSISVESWLQAAKAVSLEEGVPVKHIRLEEEHRQIAYSTTGAWSDVLGEEQKEEAMARFAAQTRAELYREDRQAMVRRQLREGDFVWGLYNRGCVWLPAVVKSVNPEGTYTLQYLTSTDEVRQAQLSSTSRQFLPRHIGSSKAAEGTVITPRPLVSERAVCAHVFDIVDTEKNGRVDSSLLAKQLQSSKLSKIVSSSSTLSTLVNSRFNLVDVLCEVFSNDSGDDQDLQGISKSEFLEFCGTVNDIVVFDFSQ